MTAGLTGYAYVWDVVGDPGFAPRVVDLGITSVALATAYHAVRAATPRHPLHQIVDASYAALYRPVDEACWAGRRLRPASPSWMPGPDPAGAAVASLHRAGIATAAWLVLTHNSRLGAAHPDVAVTNCFGEVYAYALCPAREEVREYAAVLAAEAVRDLPVSAVVLEAAGQLGVEHGGHHDKTIGAWGRAAQRWLSVCCCTGCAARWREAGHDPAAIRTALRRAVVADEPLPSPYAAVVLAARHESAQELRQQVYEGLGSIPVALHAQPDPWATGASPALGPARAEALVVPAWSTSADSVHAVARAVDICGNTYAYVSALSPFDEPDLVAHVDALLDVGARGIHLYHLGLARRWDVVADVVTAVGRRASLGPSTGRTTA